jgi:transcriptional regulator with XRE-family HTH domain
MYNLQKKRKDARYTQRQLAADARVSLRTLQYYEQGVLDINKASAATVYRLALVLGCQMDELLELDAIFDNDADCE